MLRHEETRYGLPRLFSYTPAFLLSSLFPLKYNFGVGGQMTDLGPSQGDTKEGG